MTAYLPLWFADRGLSAAEIGQVLGVASLLRVMAVPGWGWLSDALGRQRLMLFAAAAAASCCAATLPAAQGVLPLMAIVAAQGVAASALAPLADAATLALAAARRLDYGRTRAWGSVAYMAATAGAGALLGRTGSWVVPWLLAAGYGIAAGFATALPAVVPTGPATGTRERPLRARAFRLALLATALIQGSHAAYYAFASLHWRAVGISDAVIGLLIAEGIVAEVALFLWGRALVERLGPARLTGFAAACCLVRWTATAFIVNVPALALIQLLHAATFAVQHLSAMLVLRALPARGAALAQTLLAALGFSAPTGLLIWLSGRIYGEAGGLVFLVMAAVGGAALPVARAMARPQPGLIRTS